MTPEIRLEKIVMRLYELELTESNGLDHLKEKAMLLQSKQDCERQIRYNRCNVVGMPEPQSPDEAKGSDYNTVSIVNIARYLEKPK